MAPQGTAQIGRLACVLEVSGLPLKRIDEIDEKFYGLDRKPRGVRAGGQSPGR